MRSEEQADLRALHGAADGAVHGLLDLSQGQSACHLEKGVAACEPEAGNRQP